MAEHTPGPYHVEASPYGSRDFIIAPNGEQVAMTLNTTLRYHANARLFAAAPDLLAALQAHQWMRLGTSSRWCCVACFGFQEEGHTQFCAVGAAIKRATEVQLPTD